jgi:hypothetical protein
VLVNIIKFCSMFFPLVGRRRLAGGECFLTSLLAGRIIIELVYLRSILTGDWLIQCNVVIHAPGSLGFRHWLLWLEVVDIRGKFAGRSS